MMKVSIFLEAINRVSGPVGQALASVNRLNAGINRLGRSGRSSIMAMNDTVVDATHHFRRLAGPEGMQSAARSAAYLKSQLAGLTGGLSILKYASVAAVVGLGVEFGRGVLKAGGEVDQMLNTLTRLEGSASKARSSLRWMQQFSMGAGARFTMPEIMGSYKQAINFGMHPRNGNLATMADTAAGEGVPLSRIMFAVKDAMMGTSMRPLGNLGIKVHQGHGDDGVNTYDYDRGGVSQHETGKKGAENVLATLMRIMRSKYSGLGTEQAKTLPGGISQLKNLLWTFEAMVAGGGRVGGKRGVDGWILKQLNELFAWARKASADGSLAKAARQISRFMKNTGEKVVSFLKQTDWKSVGNDLKMLGGTLYYVGAALMMIAKLGGGGLSGLFNVWLTVKVIGLTRALAGFWPVLRTATTMLWPFVTAIGEFGWALVAAGGPIVWIIAGIAALAVVALLLYRNWDSVTAWWKRTWTAMPQWLKGVIALVAAAFDPMSNLPIAIKEAWLPLKGFFAELWASISNWQPPAWMRFLAGMSSGDYGTATIAAVSMFKPAVPSAPKPGPARLTPGEIAGARALAQGPDKLPRGKSELTIKFANAPAGTTVTGMKTHADQSMIVRRGQVSGIR